MSVEPVSTDSVGGDVRRRVYRQTKRVAVATVETKQVRPVAPRDLSHARPLAEPTAAAVHEKPEKYGK